MRDLILFVVAGCTAYSQTPATAAQGSYENLNSVLWMQTSAEYRALTTQIFRTAEASLFRALADRTWTAAIEQTGSFSDLPPAIILDLDETVLDNSVFLAQLTAEHGTYSEKGWSAWVAKAQARLLPGASAFLSVAHAHGVAIFFVTNRVCDATKADDPTVVLLRSLRLPFLTDRLLCRSDGGDKSPRRAYVAQSYRVLLLIGDDLNDFVTVGKTDSPLEIRTAIVGSYERYWGERWFVVPNPSYGSWERAVGLRVEEKLKGLRKQGPLSQH